MTERVKKSQIRRSIAKTVSALRSSLPTSYRVKAKMQAYFKAKVLLDYRYVLWAEGGRLTPNIRRIRIILTIKLRTARCNSINCGSYFR